MSRVECNLYSVTGNRDNIRRSRRRSRIGQNSGGHSRAGSQLGLRYFAKAHDVEDGLAGFQQVVGDDAPMAAPPYGLCAHDGAAMIASKLEKVR
jgi:hypothetical protein